MTDPEQILGDMTTLASLTSDEGRRLAEAHNIALLAGGVGRWIAVRLSDGGTDGVIYDTRADAIRHQLHERQCYYCQIQPGPMTPRSGTRVIKGMREIYASGKVDMAAPDGAAPCVIVPAVDNEARAAFARSLAKADIGRRLP